MFWLPHSTDCLLTLLPEALETWSEALLGHLLPRHLEIIFDINQNFLNKVADKWPNDFERLRRLSLIDECNGRQIRMANLCVVSAFAVNGVAELHSALLKRDLFPDLVELFPNRFKNVTNGVTPRRWLCLCNPNLAALIDQKIGNEWVTDLNQLEQFSAYATDLKVQREFWDIKQNNKQKLADWVSENLNITLNIDAIFDVQIKRLHEYKRQHLNLLHILSLYHRLLNDPNFDMYPRVFIFAAKAAPGYDLAKDIIFAINTMAEKINDDPRIKDKIKVVFLPDYRVSLAELIVPAADVSEQISTAGKEASGTGNMKLALNGAVTIGTLDGANVEMVEEVGEENFFIFGLTVEEVKATLKAGYCPQHFYESNPLLKDAIDSLLNLDLTPPQQQAFANIHHHLLAAGDPYLVLADFDAYMKAHERVAETYQNRSQWCRMAILNVALMGKFSSDRSIQDYVSQIWHLEAMIK
jgi:starch phosphorylase